MIIVSDIMEPKYPSRPLMRRNFSSVLIVLGSCLAGLGSGYEISLSRDRDMTRWKVTGNYLYTRSLLDVQMLVPSLLPQSLLLVNNGTCRPEDDTSQMTDTRNSTGSQEDPCIQSEMERREADKSGVWLAKHIPERENQLTFSYSLSHALFAQGWVHFVADPSVALILSTKDEKLLGKFWSDGKTWCDALVQIGLHNHVRRINICLVYTIGNVCVCCRSGHSALLNSFFNPVS